MKKFILFAVALVVIALVALLVLTVVEPHDIVIKRSVYIKAPKKLVLDQVIRFRNWENWGPLQQRDNTMRTTYTGTDCEIGSSLKWAGDKNTVGLADIGDFSVPVDTQNLVGIPVIGMQMARHNLRKMLFIHFEDLSNPLQKRQFLFVNQTIRFRNVEKTIDDVD